MTVKRGAQNREMASMLILCGDDMSLGYSNVTMSRVGGGGLAAE